MTFGPEDSIWPRPGGEARADGPEPDMKQKFQDIIQNLVKSKRRTKEIKDVFFFGKSKVEYKST